MAEISKGPVFLRVKETLWSDITTGVYSDKLPPMEDLAKKVGASRLTVRSALKSLEEEGLVRIRQGSGAFVDKEVVEQSMIGVSPRVLVEVIEHFRSFLTNPDINRSAKVKMIQIMETQISLIDDIRHQLPFIPNSRVM